MESNGAIWLVSSFSVKKCHQKFDSSCKIRHQEHANIKIRVHIAESEEAFQETWNNFIKTADNNLKLEQEAPIWLD